MVQEGDVRKEFGEWFAYVDVSMDIEEEFVWLNIDKSVKKIIELTPNEKKV